MRFTIPTLRIASVLLFACLVIVSPGSACYGDSPSRKTANSEVPIGHSLADRADLEAFLDGVLQEQLAFNHIAGAVVAVVADNSVVLAKGYGFADVEAKRPVDPETTEFRIASISKLFVATAIMQLVEQGRLDLDADVNTYLKSVRVPATFKEPITLKHLLTHTPGFEDNPVGLFSYREEAAEPLDTVLRAQMPARVRPPGLVTSYSNYGMALAAQVVADVSGKSYEDFVEQQIFRPLDMPHTLIRQPPADRLPTALSKGYRWRGGEFRDGGFEYSALAPAGIIWASAADMTHFMLAHLNDGAYAKTRILKLETARRMREPLFRNDSQVDAMCYGFWEVHRNGQRILQHGGDTEAFHSLFAIIPERRVGLFVSYNTDQARIVRDDFLARFLDRYFPDPQTRVPQATFDPGDVKRFAGEYGSTQYSYTTFAKVGWMLGGKSVTANADGTLTVGAEPTLKQYVPIAPLLFQEQYGPGRIVFRADNGGRITHLFFSDLAASAYIHRGFFETSQFYWGLVEVCALIFATALIAWPTIALGADRSKLASRRSGGSALLSLAGSLLSAVCLGFLAGMMIGLDESDELAFGMPRHLQYLLLVPQVCAVLALAVLCGSIIAWRRRYWRLTGRLHYTLVALAGVTFVWFLYVSNLLTFGLAALRT